MARVSASTSSGVLRIWYFMWIGLVEMKVWMRGDLGVLHRVPADPDVLVDGARQAGDARTLDRRGDRRTASKSPFEAIGKPASMMSTPSGELLGDLELLGLVQAGARRLLAVAQGGVEDPDVSRGAHAVPHFPRTARSPSGRSERRCLIERWPDGRRCLHIPPEGEQEQAEELRSRARTWMWASRLDSLVAACRMVW